MLRRRAWNGKSLTPEFVEETSSDAEENFCFRAAVRQSLLSSPNCALMLAIAWVVARTAAPLQTAHTAEAPCEPLGSLVKRFKFLCITNRKTSGQASDSRLWSTVLRALFTCLLPLSMQVI